MPSREDIIEELLSVACWCEDNLATSTLQDLSAQVDAMRCGTCKSMASNWPDAHTVQCNLHGKVFKKDFGCLSHEQKEKE